MKKIIFTAVVFLFAFGMVHAQKFAYVDSQYILENLPEYTESQAQLDEVSAQWQKEIEAKFAEVDKMYQDYQAQAVLLPEDMKKKKEQEIVDREKEAKNLQRQRFGQNGDLMKKRQELVKPIQEKVYNAIQEIATNSNYSVIFDKAGALTILFANPKYDLSDEVLDNLGAASTGRKGRSATPGQKIPEAGAGSGGASKSGQQGGQQGDSKNETPPSNAPKQPKK
ncbi:MAG: OmpH family outer membrane protein [Bacteroidetes bacterium]|nr:OmpH family outer membrane protein [Bacteroidota bacterium]